ncbi:MAG: hypothetical protein WDN28_03135 [Chthoniobacter sp.]
MGLITFATLKLQINTYQRDSLERSFSQFVSDLNNESPDVRIGALARFPEIMMREVPPMPLHSMRSIVSELSPFSSGGERRFAGDVQRQLRNYLTSATRLKGSDPGQGNCIGPDELHTLLTGLSRVGRNGWYYDAQDSLSPSSDWTWIWKPSNDDTTAVNATTLFQKAILRGPVFKGLTLANCVFSESYDNEG